MSVASVPQLLHEVETSKVFHWPTSAHSLVERLAAALEHTTVERDHACTLQTLAEEDRDALRAALQDIVNYAPPILVTGSTILERKVSEERMRRARAVLAQGKEP